MKDSRVPWIGEIPSEWQIRPVKAQYFLTTGFTPSSEDDSLYDDDGETWVTIGDLKSDVVTESKQKIAKSVAQQHMKEIAKAGSLLYSFKLSVGTVAFAGKNLYTNEAIAAFQPISKDADLHFLKYASSLIIGNANTNIYGAAIMNQKLILNAPLPVPSLAEQQAIADYLDDRCSKIDEIIAEATASIEEYKELKQAVIFEAVTKGLDKNVPMKDSGVEWIGYMPSTWNAIRIKYLLSEVNNRSETGEEEPLSVSQVLGVVPSTMISVANPASSTIGQKIVEPGDLVFNKLKAHLGVFFVSNYEGLVSPDYAVYRSNDRVNPKFLEYLFHTSACITEFKKYITGVAVGLMRLYTSDLFSIYVALPPRSEQEKIIGYLNDNVHKFDSLISEKQSLISDLQAYKKSLIYEVVTGKRRVV